MSYERELAALLESIEKLIKESNRMSIQGESVKQ